MNPDGAQAQQPAQLIEQALLRLRQRARRLLADPKTSVAIRRQLRLQTDPIAFLQRVASGFAPTRTLKIGRTRVVFVNHPDGARHVLQTNLEAYRKEYSSVRSIMGDSLLLTHGEKWQRLRKLSQPAFVGAKIKTIAPGVIAAIDRTVDDWARAAGDGEEIEVGAGLSAAALEIVTQELFGCSGVAIQPKLLAWSSEALVLAGRVAWDLMGWERKAVPALHLRRQALAKQLHRAADAIVAHRRQSKATGGDLLDLLLAAHADPDFAEMNDDQLRGEVLTFLLAGYETTATGIGWALRLLADAPEIQESIAVEIAAALGTRPPTYEDVAHLPIASALFSEAMRLCPPVPMLVRIAGADDRILDAAVRPGDNVILSQWAIHRHPEFWPDPDKFDPARFLKGGSERYPFSYLPFGGGPRACIGSRFAMVEGPLMLMRLLQRFRFAPSHRPFQGYQWKVTMHAVGGQWLRVVPRG